MKNLEVIRTASQENLSRLVELGKDQAPEVKIWGVTTGAAVAGGLVLTAGAQGLLAIFATLASLPVSLTVGAIGGGVLGWLYMEQQKVANKATAGTEAPLSRPAEQVVAPLPVMAEVAEPEVIHVTAYDPTSTGLADSDVVTSDAILPIQVEEVPPAITQSVASAVVAPPTPQDNLEDIVGIGPVFAAHLQAAGIHTFAQLAAVSPDHLLEIMAPSRGGHMIDAVTWIEQARQLSISAD